MFGNMLADCNGLVVIASHCGQLVCLSKNHWLQYSALGADYPPLLQCLGQLGFLHFVSV